MAVNTHQQEDLIQAALRYIAGGVVSLNRKVDPHIVFERAHGSKLFDIDGHEYIDYHGAFAAHLLGHNHPKICRAVRAALDENWSLMGTGTTPWEVELARLLCESVPSLERVQIANTGSEATAHAIRLSRAWTGRTDVILTLGGYNGWHNEVARSVMPDLETIGERVSPGEYRLVPLSAGIPASTLAHLHVVNFNDLDSVEYVLQKHPVACMITEPVLQNVGVILPEDGYLKGLRNLCDEYEAVLIFDEVKTGFRSGLSGFQGLAGVTPHLSVFGKAVANGYPMGAIGGHREIMEQFDSPDPAKRVLIAGTYNAHPVSTAAAIATIEMLQDGTIYNDLEAKTRVLASGLEQLFQAKGIAAVIVRNGSAFCVYFSDDAPRDWHDVLHHHDFDLDLRYRKALIEQHVYLFPLPCKQGSISAAHSPEDVHLTLERTEDILQRL